MRNVRVNMPSILRAFSLAFVCTRAILFAAEADSNDSLHLLPLRQTIAFEANIVTSGRT